MAASKCAGIRGRAGSGLISGNQALGTFKEYVRWSNTFVSNTGRAGERVGRDGSSREGRRQELLWDPTLGWDKRRDKRSLRSPEFRHTQSQDVLCLNDRHEPAWVDVELAALERKVGRADAGRPAGYESCGTDDTVSRLCHQGRLREAVDALEILVETDCSIPKSLFYALVKKSVLKKDLVLGRRVHACTVKKGFQSDTFLCNHIMRMYASHGRLQDAMDVFAVVEEPDAFMWSSIISAHVKHGRVKAAMELYREMGRLGVKPDGHVFVAALQACARGGDLKAGHQVHADVLASGIEPDLFVCNCLLDMYAKCGSLEDAQRFFDGLGKKDVVTWTALIAGYAQQGMGQEALRLFGAMEEEGTAVPNSVTFMCLLQACASVGEPALEMGKHLHVQIIDGGHQADVFVASSLVNMYAKCGSLEDAKAVFDALGEKDIVTWTAMIAGYSQKGMGQEALSVYDALQEEGLFALDSMTFVRLLQACASVGTTALQTGKQLHEQIRQQGHHADVFVANSLVNMYAKCGSLVDTRRVFDGLCKKDVVTWNAMMAGYSQQGMCQEALSLYRSMQEDGMVIPDSVTFVCLLQACASVGNNALASGKQVHTEIRDQGHQADMFVANSLVNMYAKCGSLEDARRVFDELDPKDVVTWNSLVAGYCQQGMGQEALDLYTAMQEGDLAVPNSVTFASLLQACATVGTRALETGKQLHVQIRARGYQADVFVANSLVNMYAKCGSLEDALNVFDRLGQKDVVTWTALIAGYSQQGMGQEALDLYDAMQKEGLAVPNSVTFLCLLQACAGVGNTALEKGKQLHTQLRERGLQVDVLLANSLVSMYAKCGSLTDAQRVFDKLCEKDVITWTSMIAAYSHVGMGQEVLRLYSSMQENGTVLPDSVTLACLLQACANVGSPALEMGKHLHAQIRNGVEEADMFLASSLVNMYAKCGSLEGAQSVFERLGQKNVVTWNAMIAGYSQQGMGQEALDLYSAMQEEGITAPDSVTFVCLLLACAIVGNPALEMGKQLHAQIREQGYLVDVFVSNSLVNMYSKCGSLEDAHRVFDGLKAKDVVTWNAMIAGYSQRGMGQKALHLYRDMKEECIAPPNSVTFVCLLQACADLAALHLGRQAHAQIEEQGLQSDLFVACSLINMYGKSGSIADAQQVFDALPAKDVFAWSALTAGYACLGDSEMVFDLVRRMRDDGIQPVGITFLSVLTVCSHAGLVNKGRHYFQGMTRDYGIEPTMEHYTCMVDLLGRSGLLDEALALVRTIPVPPSGAVWHTLLSACRNWGNVEVGRLAFNQAVLLDNSDASSYVLMWSIYTGAQMWVQADEMQARRIRTKAWKQPGQSWWTDMDGLVHSFVVGDQKSSKREARLDLVLPKFENERPVSRVSCPADV